MSAELKGCVTWRIFNGKTWAIDRYAFGGRAIEKSRVLLQIEKTAESSYRDLTCHVFSFEDAVAHLTVSKPSGILTTEK